MTTMSPERHRALVIKEILRHIEYDGFKPSNFELDFREITGKQDYPSWRREVNLEDSSNS